MTRALALTNKAVMEALDGLPKEKIHCSVLAEEAIQSAINDYRSKRVKHRLKIIVTSVTRNVTIQTNNPIKYNIKKDQNIIVLSVLRYNHKK